MQEEEEAFVKLIVVGDQGVGKTSMLNQYCYGKFENNQAPTIGCDYTMKVTEYQGQVVRLHLWDIAGQERYKSISKLYVRGALGCIVVGDIKDQSSLDECLRWKEIVNEYCNQIDGKNIPIMLVQNKVDETKNMGKLEDFQTMEFLQNFAKDNNFISCFQTSAKDRTNIDETFNYMLQVIHESGVIKQQQNQGNFQQTNTNANTTNNNNNTNQSAQPQAQKPITLQGGNNLQQQEKKKKKCC